MAIAKKKKSHASTPPRQRGRPRGPTHGYETMSVRFPPKMVANVRSRAEREGETIQAWVIGAVELRLSTS